MTLFWIKQSHEPSQVAGSTAPSPETPEYDEEGRRYVFRYPTSPAPRYQIDRDRIFEYLATHDLPGARARRIRRDLRNAANFYEDVREIQTHYDVSPIEFQPAKDDQRELMQLRLRSAS